MLEQADRTKIQLQTAELLLLCHGIVKGMVSLTPVALHVTYRLFDVHGAGTHKFEEVYSYGSCG